MSVKLSPIFNESQQISGIPASGGLLFTYASGSSSKQTTYKDSAGLTAHANPIVLNARGEADSPIWLTSGLSYKFLFCPSTDSDPPVSPIRTFDNIQGVNDTFVTIDQWIIATAIPTYVNATTFTLTGDKTSDFHIGRRVKAQTTAGTVYGTISNSVFTTLTTVILILDSGVLDSGLNSVGYGLLTETNNSMPNSTRVPFPDSSFGIKGSSDSTKLVKFEVDGLTTATTRTLTVQDKNLTVAGLDDISTLAVNKAGVETIAGVKTFSAAPSAVNFCKAWVNFDGTLSGSITPRASFNIASVTKTATGLYTIVMTTALGDVNYVVNGLSASAGANGLFVSGNTSVAKTTTTFGVGVRSIANTLTDSDVYLAVFGN